jgi:cell division septation protein DedD
LSLFCDETAIVQVPIVKPTAAEIDKDAIRRSLSWHPEGRCDSFTKEAILSSAPPTSGVYGLFNFDCQVFIGESANIQEALLRHVTEPDFHSGHLRVTGFTFEPCAAALRELKAAELIERFRPVQRTEMGLATTSLDIPIVSNEHEYGQESEAYADRLDFPVHERERPHVRRRFHYKPTFWAAFAAMFVAAAGAIVYLGMPTDEDVQNGAAGAGEKPPARISITQSPASDKLATGAKPRNVSSNDAAGARASQNPEPYGGVRLAGDNASGTDEPGVQKLLGPAKTLPAAEPAGSVNGRKPWSVQISAATAKHIADDLVRQLIAKGYAGYVLSADVKGQAFYRVRVGHFAEREEAESMRQSLARQEGYRDAYLTAD